MWGILSWLGLHAKWIRAIKAFYINNEQRIGNRADLGFVAGIGIRQLALGYWHWIIGNDEYQEVAFVRRIIH